MYCEWNVLLSFHSTPLSPPAVVDIGQNLVKGDIFMQISCLSVVYSLYSDDVIRRRRRLPTVHPSEIQLEVAP